MEGGQHRGIRYGGYGRRTSEIIPVCWLLPAAEAPRVQIEGNTYRTRDLRYSSSTAVAVCEIVL